MSRLISYEEVKKHNSEKSVWMVIHNDVYDVTGFLEEHPGGAESLLEYAGKDGTQAFEDVAHSEDARELMKKFKIGTVPEGERPKEKCKQTMPYEEENTANNSTGPCGYCPLGPDTGSWSPRPPGRPPERCNPPTQRSNGPPEERQRRSPPPPPPPDPGPDSYNEDLEMPISSECIKWVVIALAGALVVGLAIRALKSKSK